MRVLVIANEGDGDPGWVGEHLREVYGAELHRAWREDPAAWPALEGIDLVVSLGSDWSVYWAHVQSSVLAEMALVRAAHEQARPVLGICFGAQLAAQALGGHVEAAPEPEIGWYAIDAVEGAPFDEGPWFQWHADRFQPPAPSQILARSERAIQAFSLGRTLAVQFHPEVTLAMVQRWSSGDGQAELGRWGVERDALVAQTELLAAQRRGPAGRLVDAAVDGVPT